MAEETLSVMRIAEILEGLATDGLHWAGNEYDQKRYQRISELARQLGAEPIDPPGRIPRAPVTPKIGVDGALINRDSAILLVRRRDTGLWAMPGGAVEIGERPSIAVAREVAEETGLVMTPTRVVGVYDNWMDRREVAHHLYHIVIAGQASGGEIHPQASEILEVKWVLPQDLPDPDQFHAGHRSRVLDALEGVVGHLD